MDKKDLIKIENAAIRATGTRMAKMFQPMGEHEDDKEARRAFYEGFQEGAAFYRLLISRIDDEFANLIEGARLDSGPEEDIHSVMELAMKKGIPVITAKQTTTKSESEKQREAVRKYVATSPIDMSPENAKNFVEWKTLGGENNPKELYAFIHLMGDDGQLRLQDPEDVHLNGYTLMGTGLGISLQNSSTIRKNSRGDILFTQDEALKIARQIEGWHIPTVPELQDICKNASVKELGEVFYPYGTNDPYKIWTADKERRFYWHGNEYGGISLEFDTVPSDALYPVRLVKDK